MEIIRGKIPGAKKTVLYGPEGIGKSTLAARFPNPVFIDTENGTKDMDVARTPTPSSWVTLMDQVRYFIANPKELGTLVIDTADWAELLCIEHICSKNQVNSIESFGYGKGYTYLMEEFGRLLNLLKDLIARGVHVVITAHAKMRKFEQPDELGAYDRWEMKLSKQVYPLVKEWADIVLFANYKMHVVNVDNQGAVKGRNKVQGGKRVMYTSHHPCWDAKNRYGFPEELPLDYGSIAHVIEKIGNERTKTEQLAPQEEPKQTQQKETSQAKGEHEKKADKPDAEPKNKDEPAQDVGKPEHQSVLNIDPEIPKGLRDLMENNVVFEEEIQKAVAQKGYYPSETPVRNYDPGFISGCLVAAWEQVYGMIKANRDNEYEVPFNKS